MFSKRPRSGSLPFFCSRATHMVLCLVMLGCGMQQNVCAQRDSSVSSGDAAILIENGSSKEHGLELFSDRIHNIQIEISESTMREVEADHRLTEGPLHNQWGLSFLPRDSS